MKISNLLEHLQPGLQIAPYLSTDTSERIRKHGPDNPQIFSPGAIAPHPTPQKHANTCNVDHPPKHGSDIGETSGNIDKFHRQMGWISGWVGVFCPGCSPGHMEGNGGPVGDALTTYLQMAF